MQWCLFEQHLTDSFIYFCLFPVKSACEHLKVACALILALFPSVLALFSPARSIFSSEPIKLPVTTSFTWFLTVVSLNVVLKVINVVLGFCECNVKSYIFISWHFCKDRLLSVDLAVNHHTHPPVWTNYFPFFLVFRFFCLIWWMIVSITFRLKVSETTSHDCRTACLDFSSLTCCWYSLTKWHFMLLWYECNLTVD